MPRRHASLAAHIAEQAARLFVRPAHSQLPPLQAPRITIRSHKREFFSSLLEPDEPSSRHAANSACSPALVYVLLPLVTQFASLPPADRFALIIEGLCQAVARRCGLGGLAGPFIILIWSRLRRLKARFARHATISPPSSRPAAKRPVSPTRQSRLLLLPRRSAWLLRLVPETASGASQLRHFLADPDVAALLVEAPQLRRILRPLCRMLGIRPARALPPPDTAPTAPTAPSTPSDAPPQAAPQAAPPAAVPPQATSPWRPPSWRPPLWPPSCPASFVPA